MNFNDINKIYDHIHEHIYPNVQCLWKDVSTEEVLIDRYLCSIGDNRQYSLLAAPYVFDAESFLKRFKEKCVIFYNTPDPNDGLMLYIHQITPTFHIHSRLFCWVENQRVHDYITSLMFHRNPNDPIKFLHDNADLKKTGNTEERDESSKGFGFK